MIIYLRRLAAFVGLVLLQVLILNNIHIYGYGTPFFYIFFILKYNSSVNRNILMLWAFIFGITIDIFSNTPGVNAAAATFLAFLRNPVLKSFTTSEDIGTFSPSIYTMGFSSFLKYIIVSVLIFCTILLSIDTFSFNEPYQLLLRILSDSVITVICILCIDAIRRK